MGCEFETLQIGGMPVTVASREQLSDYAVKDALANRRAFDSGRAFLPKLVFDANGHGLSLYARDEQFRHAIDEADIVHADGGALVSFSRFLTSRPIPERSATTDMIHDFAEVAAQNGLSFFLLGATEEVNRACSEELLRRYPGLKIAGRHHGYFTELSVVTDLINNSGADFVWVGLGKPKEQLVALELQSQVNSAWLITCGGCFNFVVGAYARAPKWMQRLNLEWFHRLISNPRKLFWRYFTTNPHALYLMMTRSRRGARAT